MNLNAPEFPPGLHWLNTEAPLRLSQLRGRLVLLHFWTPCCINCTQVIPELKALEAKYGARGLVTIGVHAHKFPHEVELNNVIAAAHKLNIQHPIVVDSDHFVWQSYAVRAWPTFVLIDANGKIDCVISGEGKFKEFDERIGEIIENSKGLELRAHTWDRYDDAVFMRYPGKVTLFEKENETTIFVSDTRNNRVLALDKLGALKSFIGVEALSAPQGLCVDGTHLYICDTGAHRVVRCKLDDPAHAIEVIAGSGQRGVIRQEMEYGLLEAPLASPWDICVWNNRLVVACAGNHQLAQISPDNNTVQLLAGNGNEGLEDGPARTATLAQPAGLCAVSHDVLAFIDSETSALRIVTLEPYLGKDWMVQTIVGDGLFEFGFEDGPARHARMQHPLGCAYSPLLKAIVIVDSYNEALRSFSLERGLLVTHAISTPLSEPSGISICNGKVTIADTNAHRILRFDERALLSPQKIDPQVFAGPFGVFADFTGKEDSSRTV